MITGKYIFDNESTLPDLDRKLKEAKTLVSQRAGAPKMSVAILANVSTQYLASSIYSSMVFNGIQPSVYEFSFDQWEFELNNPESETYRRNADCLLLLLSSTRLILASGGSAREFALNLKGLLLRYRAKCPGEIVLVLPESLREGFDQTSFFYRWVKTLRWELQNELKDIAHFIDIDPLIMEFGIKKWYSTKFLLTAKLCCHPNCFPLYGNYISNFIQSLLCRPTRLVVVDLDNTLWKGIVGDVGWEGVGLDKDSGGYPYLMLQRYLLSLKEVGVLLAICSKNTAETAKKVFDSRREMILKYDDFVAHQINWGPKSENIKKILGGLNLTAAGVLFLDDSKFEREEVKSGLPEVNVPDLPENFEECCEFLSKSGYLTIGKVRDADLKKSDNYQVEKRRNKDAGKFSDYSEFLKTLNLAITPEKVDPGNFDRVYELIHKTNQFNLTTNRLDRAELQRLSASNDCFCFCYSLKDKYSDYGIISVFIAEKASRIWGINTWLMSCRAMGRGVENAVFDHFITARLIEGESVVGKYVATEKNKAMADLLARMGFMSASKSGVCRFTYGKCKNPKAEYIDMSGQVL